MPHTILLADDSVTIQKVVELTFSEGDYRVLCVSNGKAAVQKIQENRPDLLLCDVIMPEMNGYEVAAFVKKNPAYSAIPVILLTGTFEPFDEEKARQSGADTYVTKPFESKMLVEKVEELLRRRPVLSAEGPEAPVQVIHSRTEFTLGEASAPEAAPAPEEHIPLGAADHEFPMPEEAAEPLLSPLEAPAPAPVEAIAAEPPAAEPQPEELPLAKDEAEALLISEQQPEVLDLGPLPEESALTDKDFEAVLLAPPGAKGLGVSDVEIPPLQAGEADRVELERAAEEPHAAETAELAAPWEGPEPAAAEAAPEATSVTGAEDWGAGQTIAPPAQEEAAQEPPRAAEPMPMLPPLPAEEPEAAPFEVIHDMTDQQEMVSEAQSGVEAEEAHEAPPLAAEAVESAQILPDEGVETALAEVSLSQEETAVPESEITAEVPQVPAGAAALDAEELARLVSSQVEAQAPAQIREALAAALPEALRAALAEHLPPAVKQAVEQQVAEASRRAVQDSAPALLRQMADEFAPPLVAGAVRQVVPDAVDAAVREHAQGAVERVTSEQVPGLVREAAGQHVAQHLPDAIAAAVREQVGEIVRQQAQDLVRQVAWEVIPELAESLIKRRIQELESQVG